MEKAKAAVSGFISKAGHHDTTVHERVAPSVQHTTVNPEQREERTIATDREVHQDHYHTSVQPVKDREVLQEQHHHNLVPVEHRTHDHRNTQETEAHLKQNAAQFKDEHVRGSTKHTSTTMPAVGGEHVHHHIHETIQPVVQKETIEPHVVHTTVPVHEVHHNTAQHHAASALPAVNMADFKKQGGALTGREERVDHFQGEPRSIEHTLGNKIGSATSGTTGHTGHTGSGLTGTGHTGSGLTGTGHHHSPTDTTTGHTGSGLTGATGTSHHHPTGTTTGQTGTGLTGTHDSSRIGGNDGLSHGSKTAGVGAAGAAGIGGAGLAGKHSSNSSSTMGAPAERKPSLMDKLNPRKDADGDGKKGFMD